VNIIPFAPHHLAQIDLQERQRRTLLHMTGEWLQALAQGPGISGVVDDRIVGSGGIIVRAGIGLAWAVFSQDAGPYFIHMHRAARRLLEVAPRLELIEAVTEVDFPQGRRWLELLGFAYEGVLSKDGPDGADHFRYVRTA
jgi:hypothetical protein